MVLWTEASAAFPHHAHHIVKIYCEYAINNVWITTELFGFRHIESKELPFPPLHFFTHCFLLKLLFDFPLWPWTAGKWNCSDYVLV